MEQLINVILGMNAPRQEGDAPLQSAVSLPTPFGKMIVRLVDYDFVSTDPSLKKLNTRAAKDTALEEIVQQTLGSYREANRRVLAITGLSNAGVQAVKAENTTFWLFSGKRPADDPDAPNQKWKVVATISFELPGELELQLEIR